MTQSGTPSNLDFLREMLREWQHLYAQRVVEGDAPRVKICEMVLTMLGEEIRKEIAWLASS